MQKYRVGDVVRTRKVHPCGDDRWEVLRVGMDFRVRCLTCSRMVMLPRPKFEHNVKAILAEGGTEEAKVLLNTPVTPPPGPKKPVPGKRTPLPGKRALPPTRSRRVGGGGAQGRPSRPAQSKPAASAPPRPAVSAPPKPAVSAPPKPAGLGEAP
jgi:hypothetical protein